MCGLFKQTILAPSVFLSVSSIYTLRSDPFLDFRLAQDPIAQIFSYLNLSPQSFSDYDHKSLSILVNELLNREPSVVNRESKFSHFLTPLAFSLLSLLSLLS
jgi:hypothetical protein